MNTKPPIPLFDFPNAPKGKAFIDEVLVSADDYFGEKILVEPVYFNQGYKGTLKKCFIRKGVAEKLEKALLLLPKGLTFKVYDGWRSVTAQQALYDKYYNRVRDNNPSMSEEQLETETKKFVSKPSIDPENPSVHNTGGAIDLTLFDLEQKCALDLGTAFDDFTPKAYTHYFEEKETSRFENYEKIRDNRRLLYYCMTGAGFTNLPTEWWHYDYGDNFWSCYTGNAAIYKGLINEIPLEK